MAKRDYKDTIVLEPTEVEEITEVVEEEVDEKRSLLEEEREKCEKMSKGELVDYALQAKENLWCSHEEREKLQDSVKPLEDKNKELSTKVSDLEKEKRELIGKLQEIKSRVGNLEREAGRAEKLTKQVSELEEVITNKDKAAKNTQLNLERSHKAEADGLNESIKQLKDELKESKAEIKKLKVDLKKAEDRADSFEESFGEARDANFAGMIVRDIPREMGLGFEAADEQTKEDFENFMSAMRERYLAVACGAIEAADAKILSQETAADELKKAEKELEDSESLEELATQRKEAAKKKFEEARRNFIEAKDEA